MTSHSRRGSGPVEQHSLHQPLKRHHQVRRQQSTEKDKALQARTSDSIRARPNNERTNVERPIVRIAWSDDPRVGVVDGTENTVEIVACQIGTSAKSRPASNCRQPRIVSRNSGTDQTSLLYSRQELAERLRLAWKQREANKSNIDVFLAHGTTEERSDSRLSSSSSVDRSPAHLLPVPCRNFQSNEKNNETKKVVDRIETSICRTENSISSASFCPTEGARSKRTSFKNGTNAAFLGTINDPVRDFLLSSENVSADRKEPIAVSITDQKSRRTNSAPPQRRANSVGVSARTQMSIVIGSPSICKPDQEPAIPLGCVESVTYPTQISSTGGRPIKSAPTKRRAKSGKKRTNSIASKDGEPGRIKLGGSESKSSEVVTMVSLVSDADSDSEVEDNSPRDDKLISQLRSNLPTTPIIKSNVATCGSSNSIVRRPIKSGENKKNLTHLIN